MKHIRILGLAAVAAMALIALVGAGSASATVLCKNSTSSPCSETYPEGTKIKGEATNAKLTSNLATVSCTKSETTAETTSEGGAGSTVEGTVTALNFSGCTTGGGVGCTVTVNNLPYQAEVHWTEGNNGLLTVSSGGSGSPGANVVCVGVISCTFERTLFTLPVAGGNPASITASGISLERTPFGGTPLCGTEAFWDATYTAVGENKSIFVRQE